MPRPAEKDCPKCPGKMWPSFTDETPRQPIWRCDCGYTERKVLVLADDPSIKCPGCGITF